MVQIHTKEYIIFYNTMQYFLHFFLSLVNYRCGFVPMCVKVLFKLSLRLFLIGQNPNKSPTNDKKVGLNPRQTENNS